MTEITIANRPLDKGNVLGWCDYFFPLYPYLTYSGSVKDLPPNETIRGINLVVHTEQEENEAVRILNRFAASSGEEEDDDDDTSMFSFDHVPVISR